MTRLIAAFMQHVMRIEAGVFLLADAAPVVDYFEGLVDEKGPPKWLPIARFVP